MTQYEIERPALCEAFLFSGCLSSRLSKVNVPVLFVPARPNQAFLLEQVEVTAN